ncbi:MAG: transposase [Candidatus Bathyarchaeia archaeon]
MNRTNTILLTPTHEQEQQLRSLAEASARLWNMANYERRQALFKSQRNLTYAQQCKRLKDADAFKQLGTCKAQAVLMKLREAWGSYHTLKRLQRNGQLPPHIKRVSPPRYMKDRQTRRLTANTIYVRNDGYRQEDDTLILSKSLGVPFKAGDLWLGKQGRLELHYDSLRKRWCGHIPVKVKWPRKGKPHHSTRKRASIDLGICNLATCVIEDSGKAYVYSGRAVLSDWRYWTKLIAAVESELKKTNGRDSSKRLSRLYRTRRRRLDHAVKAMLRDLYEQLENECVTDLVVGDLKHIRDNANHGKVGNQKLHNFWPFAQIRQRIHELSEESGIRVRFKSERGTSKHCSLCGEKHKNGRVKRGLYKCAKTGTTLNADVNGATNILYGRKVAAVSGSRPLAWPMLLKWNSQKWEVSAA